MPVSELVEKISLEELVEWEAFEAACGPVDASFTNHLLASNNEQLQRANWFFAQKNFAGEDKERGVVHMNPLGDQDIHPIPRMGDNWTVGFSEVLQGNMTALDLSYKDTDDENEEEGGEG